MADDNPRLYIESYQRTEVNIIMSIKTTIGRITNLKIT